jgi:hypothetical protein
VLLVYDVGSQNDHRRLPLWRDPISSHGSAHHPRTLPRSGLPTARRGADGRLDRVPRGRSPRHAGEPKVYESSKDGLRHFCGTCGTGVFYVNAAVLPGLTDIQSGTYDAPEAVPAQAHVEVAEHICWMEHAHELPSFTRYPPRSNWPIDVI